MAEGQLTTLHVIAFDDGEGRLVRVDVPFWLKRWLEDNRNGLFAKFIELAHGLRPKCALVVDPPSLGASARQVGA